MHFEGEFTESGYLSEVLLRYKSVCLLSGEVDPSDLGDQNNLLPQALVPVLTIS